MLKLSFVLLLSSVIVCCWLQGPSGGVCVKQALPYVRCVGEGWPLSCDRARIEAEALALEHKLCPQHTPQVRVPQQQWRPATVIALAVHGAPVAAQRICWTRKWC